MYIHPRTTTVTISRKEKIMFVMFRTVMGRRMILLVIFMMMVMTIDNAINHLSPVIIIISICILSLIISSLLLHNYPSPLYGHPSPTRWVQHLGDRYHWPLWEVSTHSIITSTRRRMINKNELMMIVMVWMVVIIVMKSNDKGNINNNKNHIIIQSLPKAKT